VLQFNDAYGCDDALPKKLETDWETVDTITRDLQEVECNFFEAPTPEYTRWLKYRMSQTGSFTMTRVDWSIAETNVLVGLHSQAIKMAERPYDPHTGDRITRELLS